MAGHKFAAQCFLEYPHPDNSWLIAGLANAPLYLADLVIKPDYTGKNLKRFQKNQKICLTLHWGKEV